MLSRPRKRRLDDGSDSSQTERQYLNNKENFLGPHLYAISPIPQSISPKPDQPAAFHMFQDAFVPAPAPFQPVKTFPVNFSQFPISQQPSLTSTTYEYVTLSVPPSPHCDSSSCDVIRDVPVKSIGLSAWDRSSEVFAETTGRLCLLNASTKHKVTLGEIRRRLAAPETLHASLINGILRKAKSKDGCRVLRQKLAETGVSLPVGRRKTSPTTLFTAFCEKEALLLARDFDNICQSNLNTFEIARHVNRNMYSLHELDAASRVLTGILDTFEHVPQNPADYIEKNGATYSINLISLLTHGFGHNAIKTALKVTLQIVEQQRTLIQECPPSYVPHLHPTIPPFV